MGVSGRVGLSSLNSGWERDRQGLESLLQYIERPPVSLKRLRYLRDEDRVFYSGKFNPSLGRDHQLVSGLEFLAMLVGLASFGIPVQKPNSQDSLSAKTQDDTCVINIVHRKMHTLLSPP